MKEKRAAMEDILAEMESRWYDGGHTMTEPVMAQPEIRM